MKTTNMRLLMIVAISLLRLGNQQCVWAQSAAIANPIERETASQSESILKEGFTLSLASDKQKYMGGEAILLKVTMKNTTSKNLYLPMLGDIEPLQQFDFNVTTADGKSVPLTAFGKGIPKYVPSISPHGPIGSFVVYSGEGADYQFYINRIFDMSRSGVYQITVRRPRVPKLQGKGRVTLVSNTIKVEVDEPIEKFYNSRYY